LVYKVEHSHPYLKPLVENTEKVLKKNDDALLNWTLEKSFVDEVLSGFVEKRWLSPEARGNVIALLSEASFEGNKNKSSRAVRKEFTCEISLCKDSFSLGDNIVRLERIRVPLWTLRKWTNEYQVDVWEVGESNIIDDNMETKWRPSQVSGAESILPFRHYILYSEEIGYNRNVGLIPGLKTRDFPLVESMRHEQIEDFSYERELWVEHSIKTETVAQKLLESYSFEINIISQALGMNVDDFIRLILTIVKLHDLGKLNKKWQDLAGWDGKNPLAHSNKNHHKFPPHATVSAWALSQWANFGNKKLFEVILLAIAHHHSLRSSYYKEYRLIPNWQKILFECNIDKSIVENIIPEAKGFHLPTKFPDFKNVNLYRAYTFISRILKFADWKATGGDKCLITY